MKIAIDARWIFREISGIGAYTRELLRHLATFTSAHTFLVYFDDPAICARTVAETGLDAAAHIETKMLPWSLFSIRNQIAMGGQLKRDGIRVYHSPNYMIPLAPFPRGRRGTTRCITTIHDMIPMVFRDHAPASRKAKLYPIYAALMQEIGRRSDLITTVSECSKRDIMTHLGMPAARAGDIHVIPNGIGEHYRPNPTLVPDRRNDQPDRIRTILYVGRADPYKNVTMLIEAFDSLASQLPFPVRLLIAGSRDARYPEAEKRVAELGRGEQVTWTGYLSDDDLLCTYQGADVLAHPSRYEGFGLQVGEAMRCGVPVVASNGGSVPEVAGDAALLIDPDDTAGFTNALRRVLTEPDLADDLIARGHAQVAAFTWRANAETTHALYETLA
jgi:glycosyltransferase involved in cell wall biosynthesis